MFKIAHEILMEKLENGQISPEEFDRQVRRQDRWEIIRFFGVFFGGMLLLVIFFNETALGRAFDALFVNLLEFVGFLILGFVVVGGVISVVGGVISVVLNVARQLNAKDGGRDA